jgi:hypothetical protein
MARNKKTLTEASDELAEAVEALVEEVITQVEYWFDTGKDFMPDHLRSFMTKLKEKGLKVVKDIEDK